MTLDHGRRRMKHTRGTALAAVLAVMLLGPAAANAQVFQGRLIDDETNRGIDNGTMSLMLGERLIDRIFSDSTGVFLLEAPEAGMYGVTAQRVGYRETRSALWYLSLGDTLTVEYRLLPDAILLEPMLVTATNRSGQAQFRRRMNEGVGQFVTRPTMDSLDLSHPGEVFQHVEGFNLTWGWGRLESGSRAMIPRIRSGRGQGCIRYMLDGITAGPRFDSDRGRNPWSLYPLDGLTAGEIMGMEFYRSSGEVPEDLRHLAQDAMSGLYRNRRCGLVMIWTRARW